MHLQAIHNLHIYYYFIWSDRLHWICWQTKQKKTKQTKFKFRFFSSQSINNLQCNRCSNLDLFMVRRWFCYSIFNCGQFIITFNLFRHIMAYDALIALCESMNCWIAAQPMKITLFFNENYILQDQIESGEWKRTSKNVCTVLHSKIQNNCIVL